MSYEDNRYQHAHAGAGYANTSARVPFFELVQPLAYVGEEVVRLGSTVTSAIFRAVGAFVRWSNERSTIKTLEALDDFRLEDIGIRRDEIREVARRLARG